VEITYLTKKKIKNVILGRNWP